MPRYSKNRGNNATYRGISNHKVCIYSAVDEHDNCIFKIEGLGSETKAKTEDFQEYFTPNQNNSSCLITDMKQVFESLSSYTNLKHIEIKSDCHATEDGYSLSSINQLHNEFQIIYSSYRGLSTKHLQGYLNFFSFFKKLSYQIQKIKDKNNTTYETAATSKVHLFEKDICHVDMPIDLFTAYGEWHFGCFAS